MSTPTCLRPGGLALTKELLSAAALVPPADVLDGGCGLGAAVSWLREQGFAAWGVDKEPRQQPPSPWLCSGDMRQLPWPAAAFDGYLAECSLSVCGSAAQALAEAWRVLRPGGCLMVSDVCCTGEAGPSFSLAETATLAAWQRVLTAAGFVIVHVGDRSALWKPFVLEAIWAGAALEDLWCHLTPSEGGAKLGYFIMIGRKPR